MEGEELVKQKAHSLGQEYFPMETDLLLPAWSLHRLIEIAQLPQYWECISGNWYDEVIAYIQRMIYINGFNKEYLEK